MSEQPTCAPSFVQSRCGLLFRDGHDAVRATLEALDAIDGSTAPAVSLLTGLSPERLEELGGFELVVDD